MQGIFILEFSFLHIADIHLGRPFSDLSKYSENHKNILNRATEKTFNNIIDFALNNKVDFVLIAGDTFDSENQDFSSQLILKRGLKKLEEAEIKAFLICGNHDCVNSYNKNTFNYAENSLIKIIGINTPNYTDIEVENNRHEKIAVLHALSYTTDKMNENPIQYFSKSNDLNRLMFHIGLLHSDITSEKDSSYAPCSYGELENIGYDYWALGHIHKPEPQINDKIQYSGTVQGRNIKETGAHGIRFVNVENNIIVRNEFIKLDTVRFEEVTADISSVDDLTQAYDIIFDSLENILNDDFCDLHLVNLNLSGITSLYGDINDNFYNGISDKISESFNQKICISQISNKCEPRTDNDILENDDGISGELYRTAYNDLISDEIISGYDKEFAAVLEKCEFDEKEYDLFKNAVKKSAKEDCVNISSLIYSSHESGEN